MRRTDPNFEMKRHPRSETADTQVADFTPAEEEALEKFGAWLDGELEQLVARWVHLAAPNASHRERALRRTL